MKESGKSKIERERERKREREREREREEFQKQMNEVVRVDTTMQILNLMLILYGKKTMIESVLISICEEELFFGKKM